MKVLYSSHRTTIPELSNFVATVAKQLYTEALAKDVLISGPQYWIYHGMDGKPGTVFTLEIALPIQGDIQSSTFKVKDIPAFKAVCHWHEGPWEKMEGTYGTIIDYIGQHKIPMIDECREVYYNVDFADPANNRVMIQLGIL